MFTAFFAALPKLVVIVYPHLIVRTVAISAGVAGAAISTVGAVVYAHYKGKKSKGVIND